MRGGFQPVINSLPYPFSYNLSHYIFYALLHFLPDTFLLQCIYNVLIKSGQYLHSSTIGAVLSPPITFQNAAGMGLAPLLLRVCFAARQVDWWLNVLRSPRLRVGQLPLLESLLNTCCMPMCREFAPPTGWSGARM